ncbi:FG-GAP and VCBS repeat-containing protein [Streptomyces sp. NPDC053474]|uniref:FG-GAP and VCBS repeat-containing protein n=1 Tax=Streptomyces sp. NPDC053474 TaxID=3365704 RepID=UPI0037CFB30D
MRKKTLSAAVLCAATVIGVAGLSATPAAAAEPAPRPKADFNGDGFADLAVGVPDATVGGKTKAGYVNVVWGGKNGLGKHGSATISQDSAGVPGNAEKGDGFGRTVRPADMNGDGITDIVVGTPDEDSGAKLSTGTVTVLWGSKSGIKGGFTAASGEYSDNSLGAVLTTGDFDGDGKQDIVLNSHFDESSALMLRPGPFKAGTPAKLSRVDSWHFGGPRAVTTGDFDGDGRDDLALAYGGMEILGTKVISRASGEWKPQWSTGNGSTALAAGDFDGDGTTDLALGGVQANPESEDPSEAFCQNPVGGAIATVYGKKDAALGGPVACTTQDSPEVGGTAEIEDDFGAHLAVGNLDRDGVDELIVGADTETVGTAKKAGSYWTLASAGTGKPFVGPSFTQNSAGVPGTAEAGDRFGAAVATGDFNGDGYPDTAVGAPGEDAATGGVWYGRTPKDGPNPPQVTVTPGKLSLKGAHAYGAVLGR